MSKITKTLQLIASIIFLIYFEQLPAAKTRYYDVELILIENLKSLYQQSEFWKKSINRTEPEIYALLDQPYPGQIPDNYSPELTFKSLDNTDFRLSDVIAHLRQSKRHRIVLHMGWRQPGMSKTTALAIKIDHFIADDESKIVPQADDSTIQTNNENVESKQYSEIYQSQNLFQDQNNDERQIPGARLYGNIRLILSRYLHLEIDLSYQKTEQHESEQLFDLEDETIADIELADIYHLKQTRRLRSKELHYIDHPVIAMIVLITPYIPDPLEEKN